MYIENEKWEKLKSKFKELYSNYNYYSDNVKYLLDNADICIDDIEENKSDKLYVITNNSVIDDEINYGIKGVAFTKEKASKIFEEAIEEAKIDIDFDNLDAIDTSNDIESYDENWYYSKSNNYFELFLNGEYNSNNFAIEIKEYDIGKTLSRKEVDINE